MFKILHISDIHYSSQLNTSGKVDAKVDIGILSSQESEFFQILEKHLSTYSTKDKINLFVISGDIINGRDRQAQKKFSEKFIELIKKYEYSKNNIMVVPGNHDVMKGSAISSKERYDEFFDAWDGCKLPYLDGVYRSSDIVLDKDNMMMIIPLNTSNWSQVRIKLSETIEKHISTLDDNIKKEFERQFTYDAANVSQEQLILLEKEIKEIPNHEKYNKVLVQHHHLTAVDDSIEVKELPDILNIDDLKRFIKDFNIRVVLHGHKHRGRAFSEYLNKDNIPFKLLISSSSNVNSGHFFTLLDFDRLDVNISTYNRKGTAEKNESFMIYDSLQTESSIILEDDNITRLYNKICSSVKKPTNKNKQFICHLNLQNYKVDTYPIPMMYKDKADQKQYEYEIEKHVKWWQQSRSKYSDEVPLHGVRLKKHSGYINQLENIKNEILKDPFTSRGVATLLEPTKDFINTKGYIAKTEYPSFINCQFIVREDENIKYLDVIAYYRVQEMRYWWSLNISELFRLLKDMQKELGADFKIGKITTITSLAKFVSTNAFGGSFISTIDYHVDVDSLLVANQAHSIMCKKANFKTIAEVNNADFIKLWEEVFDDLKLFTKAKNNKDGNSRLRDGIRFLVNCVAQAKDDSCAIQNNFHLSLKRLAMAIDSYKSSNSTFEEGLKDFSEALKDTLVKYEKVKYSLVVERKNEL